MNKQYKLNDNKYAYVVPKIAENPESFFDSYPCSTEISYYIDGKKHFLYPISEERNFEDFSVIGFSDSKYNIDLKEDEKLLIIKENL